MTTAIKRDPVLFAAGIALSALFLIAIVMAVGVEPSAFITFALIGTAACGYGVFCGVSWLTSEPVRRAVRLWWIDRGADLDEWAESLDDSHVCYHLGCAGVGLWRATCLITHRLNLCFAECLYCSARGVVLTVTCRPLWLGVGYAAATFAVGCALLALVSVCVLYPMFAVALAVTVALVGIVTLAYCNLDSVIGFVGSLKGYVTFESRLSFAGESAELSSSPVAEFIPTVHSEYTQVAGDYEPLSLIIADESMPADEVSKVATELPAYMQPTQHQAATVTNSKPVVYVREKGAYRVATPSDADKKLFRRNQGKVPFVPVGEGYTPSPVQVVNGSSYYRVFVNGVCEKFTELTRAMSYAADMASFHGCEVACG